MFIFEIGMYFCLTIFFMTQEDCFELGHFSKTHGLKGEIVLFLDVDNPEAYEELDSVFVEIKNELVPFFIENFYIRGNKAILRFEGYESWEQANELVKKRVFLPLDNLPKLKENQFYYHDVLGFTVVDQQLGKLGVVSTFFSLEQGDLLVMTYQEKEVLIPINDTNVLKADLEMMEVLVNLPNGLLEVYLND
jgi:16S rRNA processing protein RimM